MSYGGVSNGITGSHLVTGRLSGGFCGTCCEGKRGPKSELTKIESLMTTHGGNNVSSINIYHVSLLIDLWLHCHSWLTGNSCVKKTVSLIYNGKLTEICVLNDMRPCCHMSSCGDVLCGYFRRQKQIKQMLNSPFNCLTAGLMSSQLATEVVMLWSSLVCLFTPTSLPTPWI